MAHTDAALNIKCPHCALPVDLPPSRWSEDVASCPRCGYDADLRPDPRVVIEQLRISAKLLVIKAEALSAVPASVVSSSERWRVWEAARRARSIVGDLDAP